jgi:glucose/mannose-6-phosphate isomerase
MQVFIEQFTSMLSQSVQEAKLQKPDFSGFVPSSILISGLGGSGIGGTIVSEWASKTAAIPVVVSKDYEIPQWAGPQTLFIASSYSGGTEETLSALHLAQKAGCRIVCITSGGKLAEIAKGEGYPILTLPEGYPPRAAFPFALAKLTAVFFSARVFGNSWEEALQNAAEFLENQLEHIRTEAREIAEYLHGKIPVLYAATGFEGVAVRWRQQINENSKELCWHHVLPEMNHNELVGWAGGDARFAAVFMRSGNDHYRTLKRMELSADIISERGGSVRYLDARGSHPILQSLYLILVGDYVSLYLAQIKGVDPVEVNVISGLKNELGKLV